MLLVPQVSIIGWYGAKGVVAGPACGLERANVVGLKADPNTPSPRRCFGCAVYSC